MVQVKDLASLVSDLQRLDCSEDVSLPGFASFLEAILALDGIMNLSRNALRGSAASRDAAYSLVAAFSGKVGLVWRLLAMACVCSRSFSVTLP